MRPPGRAPLALAAASALVLLPARNAAGQLPRVDAAGAGVGDHAVATARGFSAVASNPAGLGLGKVRFSATVLALRGGAGLEPVSLGEIGEHGGEILPDRVREEWLRRVRSAGAERGTAALSVSPFSLSFGRLGIQLSTVASGSVEMNGDAVELVLFGNAGHTGDPRAFDLAGSRVDGWVVSTLALAYGLPVANVLGGRMALGGTGKLSVGHALLVGRDAGSTLDGSTPDLRVSFPVLTVAPGSGVFAGPRGVGLDLGAAWERGDVALGLTVRNVLNTFGWGLDDLVFRPGTALFRGDGDPRSDFDPRPAGEAPGSLRRAALALEFGPAVEVGMGTRLGPRTTLVASVERRFGHDDGVVPRTRVGAGVETRVSDRLPLRAHASLIEESLRVGAGASVALGGLRIGGSGSTVVGSTRREGWLGSFAISWVVPGAPAR